MEKILWISRHAMTGEQKTALIQRREVFSWKAREAVEIVHLNVTLPAHGYEAVRVILDLCKEHEAGVVAAVLPAHVAAAWILRGVRCVPRQFGDDVALYLPVSVPAPAVEGETRGGGFVFSHWEVF